MDAVFDWKSVTEALAAEVRQRGGSFEKAPVARLVVNGVLMPRDAEVVVHVVEEGEGEGVRWVEVPSGPMPKELLRWHSGKVPEVEVHVVEGRVNEEKRRRLNMIADQNLVNESLDRMGIPKAPSIIQSMGRTEEEGKPWVVLTWRMAHLEGLVSAWRAREGQRQEGVVEDDGGAEEMLATEAREKGWALVAVGEVLHFVPTMEQAVGKRLDRIVVSHLDERVNLELRRRLRE